MRHYKRLVRSPAFSCSAAEARLTNHQIPCDKRISVNMNEMMMVAVSRQAVLVPVPGRRVCVEPA